MGRRQDSSRLHSLPSGAHHSDSTDRYPWQVVTQQVTAITAVPMSHAVGRTYQHANRAVLIEGDLLPVRLRQPGMPKEARWAAPTPDRKRSRAASRRPGGHLHPRGSYGPGLPGKAVAVCHQVDRGQRLP
jgi:hypothetical protein